MTKKNIVKTFLKALIASALLFFIVFRPYSLRSMSNAFGIVAILCIVLGAFRQATYLKFFDLPNFGFKKMYEMAFKKNFEKKDTKVGEYHDYVKTVNHEKNYMEMYIVGAALVALSLVVHF